MKQTKEEINEELAHQRAILRALNGRRRPLEMQAAQKGINTPPEVLTELSTLIDQIRTHEEELARKETSAAEDQLPLAEVEYRVRLADVWSTPQGRPTAAGIALLERDRLRLGVSPERAQTIEQAVRATMAEENLADLDLFTLIHSNDQEPLNRSLDRIARAYRFDAAATFHILETNLNNLPREELDVLIDRLERRLIRSRIWTNPEERLHLARFLFDLREERGSRPMEQPAQEE